MFELHVAIKKAVIYQLMAMILLFCYAWFWFGEPVSSLSFTASFALVLMVYYIAFEYVWDKEIKPAVSGAIPVQGAAQGATQAVAQFAPQNPAQQPAQSLAQSTA